MNILDVKCLLNNETISAVVLKRKKVTDIVEADSKK